MSAADDDLRALESTDAEVETLRRVLMIPTIRQVNMDRDYVLGLLDRLRDAEAGRLAYRDAAQEIERQCDEQRWALDRVRALADPSRSILRREDVLAALDGDEQAEAAGQRIEALVEASSLGTPEAKAARWSRRGLPRRPRWS